MSAGGIERPVPEKPARQERIPLGILFMLGASVAFSASSAMSKWLVETYPIGEVLFTRALGALFLTSLIILPRTGLTVFRTRHLGQHAMRGVSQSLSQSFILIAFSLMPLASAVAINFSAPLFATLAAILLFKERVGLARWAALIVGFGGVLLVTQPGVGAFQLGALFALANAVLFGTVTAGVRGMTITESAETLIMYQMVILVGVFAPLLAFGALAPSFTDALALGLNGIANGLGQYWWTRALHLAPISAVAPFNYFSLVWAMMLGFAVWGDVPTASLLIGSGIVVATGLSLFWREARRR